MAGHRGREVRAWTLDVEMDHPDIAQLRGPGHQRVQEDGGGRGGTMDVDLIARSDPRDSLLGRDDPHQPARGIRQARAVDPVARAAVMTGLSTGLSRAAPGSWITSAVTIPNIPSWPSACWRMWQWNAQAPGSLQSMMTSQRSPGFTPSVSQVNAAGPSG